jgi:hypothetical protein
LLHVGKAVFDGGHNRQHIPDRLRESALRRLEKDPADVILPASSDEQGTYAQQIASYEAQLASAHEQIQVLQAEVAEARGTKRKDHDETMVNSVGKRQNMCALHTLLQRRNQPVAISPCASSSLTYLRTVNMITDASFRHNVPVQTPCLGISSICGSRS